MNNIQALIDVDGNLTYKLEEIEKEASSYYTNLFNGEIYTNFPKFQSKAQINMVGQQFLMRKIQLSEAKKAVFLVHDDKSLGPDGLNAKFFKLHWDQLKWDLLEAIQDMFDSAKLPKGINHTFIVLIPKIDRPSHITHYKPISCCNMYYKIFSKVLCERLKIFLPTLISDNQSAFVQGRHICENILLAHEMLRDFNRRGVQKFCIKVDLQKAYDSVNR